jgi:hypothetical protein
MVTCYFLTWAAAAKKALQPARHQVPIVQALHVCCCSIYECSNAAARLIPFAARLVGQVPGVNRWIVPAQFGKQHEHNGLSNNMRLQDSSPSQLSSLAKSQE